MGVPPWELAERPLAWREWALIARGAEARAELLAHKLHKLPGMGGGDELK